MANSNEKQPASIHLTGICQNENNFIKIFNTRITYNSMKKSEVLVFSFHWYDPIVAKLFYKDETVFIMELSLLKDVN